MQDLSCMLVKQLIIIAIKTCREHRSRERSRTFEKSVIIKHRALAFLRNTSLFLCKNYSKRYEPFCAEIHFSSHICYIWIYSALKIWRFRFPLSLSIAVLSKRTFSLHYKKNQLKQFESWEFIQKPLKWTQSLTHVVILSVKF